MELGVETMRDLKLVLPSDLYEIGMDEDTIARVRQAVLFFCCCFSRLPFNCCLGPCVQLILDAIDLRDDFFS